jgi:SAM-dependent methyltransferase
LKLSNSEESTPLDPVQRLFNEEAVQWHGKYEPGGSMGRRIALFASRLRSTTLPPAPILEFGCGTGDLANRLSLDGYDVTACDIAEEMIGTAQRTFPQARVRWTRIPTGPTRLPFADGSFEAVVSSSVYEYIDNVDQAFRECARVLAPDGVLILTVPNPTHFNRRIEQALRPAAILLCDLRGVDWPRRVRSTLNYLKLSKNRFPLERWEALARQADLHRSGLPVDLSSPLALLTFRRGTGRTPTARP